MSWISSLVIGLLTAVVGCFSAGFLGAFCVRWFRISSFEGGSGYYMLAFAFFGTLVGLAGGITCARVFTGVEGMHFLKGLGISVGGMLALVTTVGIFCRLGADVAPKIDGKSLALEVEIRGGKSFEMPVKVDDCAPFAGVHLQPGRRQPTALIDLDAARQVGGRWIFPARMRLETSQPLKFFRAYFNEENDGFFALRLRSRPTRADLEWSNWIDSGWNADQPEPPAEEKLSLRYRVQVIEPPPPGPSQAEIAAENIAKEEAEFAAIAPDAPLTTWLPYTRYGADEDRLRIAVGHMTARPNFAQELGDLMLSTDQDVAVDALRVVEHLPEPSPDLLPGVVEAGRAIAGLMRKVNATTPEEDPSYLGAADVAVRFSAWMVAVRTLREKAGGDFTPQLAEMLELSRVREESYVMRQDVRRVASYYMQQWAGLEPLVSDPKPR